MKKIGFIGASDKTNLIMHVAKVLDYIGKKVIVVDTTITQKTKYVVPAINPTLSYITDFENVDYAIGFKSLQEIKEYFGLNASNLEYDYMLIDIDKSKTIEEFEIEDTGQNYFVTGFDIYSLRRGVSILKNLQTPLNLSKVLYDYGISSEDEEYLNYLSLEAKVIWNEFSIYIPVVGVDKQVIEENQRIFRIRLKKLTPEYLEGIVYIAQDIVKDLNVNKIKKMIRE